MPEWLTEREREVLRGATDRAKAVLHAIVKGLG
jgi:hypothetical protein